MPKCSCKLLSLRALFTVSCAFFIYSLWIAMRWQHCKVVHWINLPNDEFLSEDAGGAWYKLRHQHDAMAVFFSRLQYPEAKCETMKNLESRHGLVPLCIADHFLPISPCLVFSFNIYQPTDSDTEIAEKYDCVVNVFDPMLEDLSPERHPKVNTFRFCIGTRDTDHYRPPTRLLHGREERQWWGVRTYRSLLTEAKYSGRVVDLIKMSVAGMEYDILDDMLQRNNLRSVKQLLIQFHTDIKRKEDYFRYLNLLIKLNKQGFRVFHGMSNYSKVPCMQGYCDVHSISLINIYHDT